MKISCCMITAGEPGLERAVASIRPHVDEVVAIVTRPATLEDLARYEKLFDNFAVDSKFFPLGPDGEVVWEDADFAAARNASFALATGDAICWIDSDDEVVGGENLRVALEKLKEAKRFRLLAKYEYALHEGRVVVEQWRERVTLRGTPYSWRRPVHEHLTADDGRTMEHDVKLDTVTWRHHRPVNQPRSERNLRILLAHEKRLGDAARDDAWLHNNLALELQRSQRFAEALQHFEAYDRLSERTDEKALSAIQAADACLALGPLSLQQQERALAWCRKAQGYRRSFETLFAEAKVQFIRGSTGGDPVALERARDALREALALPPTVSPLAVQPVDRALNAPELLRVVCDTLRDWRGAAAACARLLEAGPDAVVAMQRQRYERLAERDEHPAKAGRSAELDVVFACGPTVETWNPRTVAEGGIGGSETAVVEVSRRLAAVGHHVRVYTDCGEPGVYDGVWWMPSEHLRDAGDCDVAVVWRNGKLLEFFRQAKARVVWAHDVAVHELSSERALLADRVFGLTDWHCEQLRKLHGLHPAQMFRTRNGLDLARFEGCGSRDPHKAVYSSSPDRGLPALLDMWPKIRARVPDAQLSVLYGFQGIEKMAAETRNEMARYLVESMKRKMRELPGVTYHGRVDQKTLAREMLSAGVMAYPTWWVETSCISMMEAQAAGLRIVTSPLAALKETVGERGVLVEGDWLSDDYQAKFVDAVVDAMLRPEDGDRAKLQAYARQNFSWDGVVEEWLALFEQLLDDAAFGVLPPYQGAAAQ